MKILSLIALSSPLFCLPLSAITLSFDESVDGDLGAPETPTMVALGVGNNTFIGSVNLTNGDTRDAIAFTIGAGQILDSILLTSYDNPATAAANDGDRGFFHIDDALVSSDPAAAGAAPGFLTGRTFVFSELDGADLLDTDASGIGAIGITGGQLGAGDYTFSIQNTEQGNVTSNYELAFNVVAVPEPSVSLLAGIAGIACLVRRRRE